jgi:hypothetical protein
VELEVLTCIQCSSTWNRQKTRGRKPKLCPSCILTLEKIEDGQEDDIEEILVLPEEPRPSKTKYRAGTKWKCPSCEVSIKINIGINDPPTHPCKKRLKKVLPLELQ